MSQIVPPFFILGSASPRRAKILENLGLKFRQIPSSYDESGFVWSNDFHSDILKLVTEKAKPLAQTYPGELILTADTTVILGERIFNKPQTRLEALEFLKQLQGQTHQVLTALCLYESGQFHTNLSTTYVSIRALSPFQIEQYVDTQLPYDRAGGYTIEGVGSLLVEKIQGCYYNVLGLSALAFSELLELRGYNLWAYACSQL